MSRPKNPSPDPYRKARFREEARGIVCTDRHERKYRRAVDTAGAIARALERAYKLGFLEAREGLAPAPARIPADGPVDWILIPPRPRQVFWSCCLFTLGRQGDRTRLGYLEPAVTDRGTMGWRLVVEDSGREKEVMGDNSIRPLIRLRLFDPIPTAPDKLTISARGRATWEWFLARGGRFPDDLSVF